MAARFEDMDKLARRGLDFAKQAEGNVELTAMDGALVLHVKAKRHWFGGSHVDIQISEISVPEEGM